MRKDRVFVPYVVLAAGLAASASALGQGMVSQSGADVLADWQEFERLMAEGDRKADLNRDGTVDTFDALAFLEKMQGGGGQTDNSPKLYLGVGNHWEDTAWDGSNPWSDGHDFGPTEMNYRWFTQTNLKIRAAKDYSSSMNPQNWAYAKVDPGTSTYELRYWDTATSMAYETGNSALSKWAAAAISNMHTSFDDDPLSQSGGRFILLDNESLHWVGWYWGRYMQAQQTTIPPLTTVSDINDHTTALRGFGVAFMDELQDEFSNDMFAWYNLPADRSPQATRTMGDPKYNPWNGDAWDWAEETTYGGVGPDGVAPGTFPWWSVDYDLLPLLQQADYVDGKLYVDADKLSASDQTNWLKGQMDRGLGIASQIQNGRPYMARIWFHDDKSPSILRDEDYIARFFAAAVAEGVEHAAVEGGRWVWECACELEGKTWGQMWNDLVVQEAYTAGYLTTAPVSELTLVSATPDSGLVNSTVNVSLWGSKFTNGTSVAVSGSGITVGTPTLVSANEITVDLTISAGATLDWRDITVTDSGSSWLVEDAFKVFNPQASEPAPAPEGFRDSWDGLIENRCVGPRKVDKPASSTEYIPVRLAGKHFQDGCGVTVSFVPGSGSGVSVDTVTFVDSHRIDVLLEVTSAADTGEWVFSVTNPDSQSAADWVVTIE